MNDRETKSRAELEAEVAGLKEENARLRPLLGLDERKTDGHATAWSPMLLPEEVSTAPLDSSSPDLEKLALLASLFGARSDVQATRWENVSTGKAGWSPATRRVLVAAAVQTGLPSPDRRGLRRAPSGTRDGRHLPAPAR